MSAARCTLRDHLPWGLSLRARPPRLSRVASSRHGRFAKLENPQLFLDNGIACASVARAKRGEKKRELGLRRSHDLWVREAREETKEEEKATKGTRRLIAVGRTRQDRCYLGCHASSLFRNHQKIYTPPIGFIAKVFQHPRVFIILLIEDREIIRKIYLVKFLFGICIIDHFHSFHYWRLYFRKRINLGWLLYRFLKNCSLSFPS